MNGDLLRRLIEAGTPAHLVAEVAVELGRAQAAAEVLESRRRKDRERKANLPRNPRNSTESSDGAEFPEQANSSSPLDVPLPSPAPQPSPLNPPTSTPEEGAGAEVVVPFPKTESRKADRATRMPADFTLTAERLAFARKEGLTDEKSRREFAKFADHHGARGNRFVDWDRAWQNWARKAADGFGSPVRPAAGGHGTSSGGRFGAMQRALARVSNPDLLPE